MSQGSWGGGGGGGGWGQGGGGYGGPPGGGGYGPPGGPPGGGGGGHGPPPGGYGPPGGGGYGSPPGGYGGPPGFAPQPPGYPPGYTPPGSAGGVVPWEDPSLSLFARWWTTVREVSLNPRPFFAAAAQNDNPWPALTFGMTTAGLAGLVLGGFLALFYIGFGGLSYLGMSGSGSSTGTALGAGLFGFLSVLGLGIAILYPVMFVVGALIAPWIYGGVHHLMLVLFKGATKSYTHTVRVSAYSYAGYFWFMIPLIGPMAGAVITLIALVIGLDETHKCGVGKSLGSIFLPVGVCCLCGCMLQIVAFAAGAPTRP